jgi:enoyl-CoA hydratase/carnithine racemase
VSSLTHRIHPFTLPLPQNVIGLLPDVAFAHLAKRAPPAVGLWMALTGARVRHAKDLLYARLGTHYVPAGDVAALRAALLCVQLQAGDDEHAVVQSVLSAHARDCPDGGMLATLQPTLARVFGQPPRVADIVVALQAEVREAQRDGDAVNGWDAAQTLQLMLSGSPTSLMVTHMHYTAVAAADDDVEQVLRSEHAVCTRLINQAPGKMHTLIDNHWQVCEYARGL